MQDMANADRLELQGHYNQLRELHNDPVGNADLIKALTDKIRNLESSLSEQKKKDGLTYSEELGIFLTQGQKKELDDLKDKKKPDLGSSATVSDNAQPIQYSAADRHLHQQPLGNNQWYNTVQVEALTGQKVPTNPKELGEFLKSANPPVSFVYLTANSVGNHFVNINLGKDGQVTYIDPNGEEMQPNDRKELAKLGLDVNYIDHQGNKVSEAQAKTTPLKRVQFDGHNCGMYSSCIASMMKEANGDPERIKAGLESIKNIDPKTERAAHSEYLHAGIESGKPYQRTPSLEEQARQAGKPARDVGATVDAQTVSTNFQATALQNKSTLVR